MEILHGQIFALYLFDVAEAADLQAAAAAIGGSVRSKFAPKPATPAYVQYQTPPLWFEGAAVDFPSIDGFRVGFKLFDYGIIWLRLTREFSGGWTQLAQISNELVENEVLERQAEHACRTVADRLKAALTEPRQTLLSEDYLVFAVHELSRSPHRRRSRDTSRRCDRVGASR